VPLLRGPQSVPALTDTAKHSWPTQNGNIQFYPNRLWHVAVAHHALRGRALWGGGMELRQTQEWGQGAGSPAMGKGLMHGCREAS
jgi:hypothetical protein